MLEIGGACTDITRSVVTFPIGGGTAALLPLSCSPPTSRCAIDQTPRGSRLFRPSHRRLPDLDVLASVGVGQNQLLNRAAEVAPKFVRLAVEFTTARS